MAMIKKSMATIDGLGLLTGLNSGISSKSTVVDAINSVYAVANSASSGFGFYTVADTSTSFTAVSGDQVHVTDDGDGTWAVYRVTSDITSATVTASAASLEKIMDADGLWDGLTDAQVTNVTNLIDNISVTQAVDLDDLESTVAGLTSNVSTNLSTSTTTTTVTVESSDGTDATLSAATTLAAGIMTTTMFDKLDGIEANATADQTAQEIATAIDADTDAEATLKSALGLGTAAYTASTAYATAAQGTLADSALQTSDIGVSIQAYNVNTVVDANYVATANDFTDTLKNKLDLIEANATADQTAQEIANAIDLDTTAEATLKSALGITSLEGTVDGLSTNVTTNLSTSTTTTDVTVVSSDGTNATLSAATTAAAGIMTTTMFDKLDGIEANATADQTAQEIATAIDADTTAEATLKSALGLGTAAYQDVADIAGTEYTITTENLVVNASGQITLAATPIGGTLLNFNTARHTTGGVSTDYAATVSGTTVTVDVSLETETVAVQYMREV